MVYTRALGARAVRRGGSSPLPGTKQTALSNDSVFCLCQDREGSNHGRGRETKVSRVGK